MVDLRFRAVLFDLFDTLVLFDEVKDDYPVYLDGMHEALLNHGVNVSFEVFKKTYFEVRNEIIERSRKTLEDPHFNLRISLTMQRLGFNLTEQDQIVTDMTKAFSDEFKSRTRPDPNAKNVLQQLHQTYKLGLVSNFSIPECGYELLDQFGLKQFLDAVVISGTVNRRKPSPEIFSTALKALGVEASETIFVGDSLSDDIQGPQNVGMTTILIKRRPIPEDNKVKPDAIVERLSELPKLLAVLKLLWKRIFAENNPNIKEENAKFGQVALKKEQTFHKTICFSLTLVLSHKRITRMLHKSDQSETHMKV